MRPHNIRYGDWVLESVRFSDLHNWGYDLMAGEARLVNTAPSWRNTATNRTRTNWDIPGFDGFACSSDESVFQVETPLSAVTAGGAPFIWVSALTEGTAFLQFQMPDDGIILQASITVSPRPETYPSPGAFLIDPQVVNVAPGESTGMAKKLGAKDLGPEQQGCFFQTIHPILEFSSFL